MSNVSPQRLIVVMALALVFVLVAPAIADDADDIGARLAQWSDDFNAGRTDAVCDLFSRDLVARFRGQPERNYAEVCDLLHESLTDPARSFHYDLALHEIIVEGDLAVVRLTWTLTVTPPGAISVEPGMDIFRREADGRWRIIRYLAYEAP